MFNIGKSKIQINFWFAVILSVIAVFDKSGYAWLGILTALLHELGHIIAMGIKGGFPKEIKFDIFNIDIVDDFRGIRNYKDDIFILLCGALMNFIAASVSLFIYYHVENIIFLLFFWTNLFIGIFNILPVSVLDGGQALYLFLANKFEIHKCYKIVEVFSILVLIPILLIGFLILLKSKYNFSLLFIGCYLIIMTLFNDKNKGL